MLDPNRKYFLTASIAHTAMAGFEAELAGMSVKQPDFAGSDIIICHLTKTDSSHLVSDMKKAGFDVTGAQIKECLAFIKAKTIVFSQGMETAALQIAMSEFIAERDESFKSKDMERGNIQEGEAIEALTEKTGITFDNIDIDQQFLSDGDLGVTPDGIEYNGFDIVSCAEVKNPKDTTHMRYLATLKNQEDMLKECPDYYWQAQTGLAVTGANTYHWASYHNGFKNGYNLVYVPITPNLEHINMLRIRAARIMERVPVIIEDIKTRFE